jgi:hypothetical protein
MIQHFMGEGANVVVDEDEHLAILACRLKLQVDKMKNTAFKHGGSKFGRSGTKQRQRIKVLP